MSAPLSWTGSGLGPDLRLVRKLASRRLGTGLATAPESAVRPPSRPRLARTAAGGLASDRAAQLEKLIQQHKIPWRTGISSVTFGKRALEEQRDILKALYNRLDRPTGPSEEESTPPPTPPLLSLGAQGWPCFWPRAAARACHTVGMVRQPEGKVGETGQSLGRAPRPPPPALRRPPEVPAFSQNQKKRKKTKLSLALG